jgi:anaerobic selenocysteine-containing dehydrogenase
VSGRRDDPLQVVRFLATRAGDPDRGPMVWLNEQEARNRLLVEGELVFVEGPKRKELAQLVIDDALRRGECVVRDVAGVLLTDVVRVRKPDFDRGPVVRV